MNFGFVRVEIFNLFFAKRAFRIQGRWFCIQGSVMYAIDFDFSLRIQLLLVKSLMPPKSVNDTSEKVASNTSMIVHFLQICFGSRNSDPVRE